jgi:hypothetical protein
VRDALGALSTVRGSRRSSGAVPRAIVGGALRNWNGAVLVPVRQRAAKALVALEVEAYPLLNEWASNKGMQLTKRGLSSCRNGETGCRHLVALRS